MGSNRRFFEFWEEKWIDWEEKMIEGNTPKNKLQTDKFVFEVYQMKYQFIDWDSIPDVINKDQFYRICHISKSTA